MEQVNANSVVSSGISTSSDMGEMLQASGVYTATCYDAEGNLKWTDTYTNLVTTVGKNDLLDKYLAGSTYTAAWYLGLVDGGTTPTYAAGDTLASHSGWSEIAASVTYTAGGSATNRATPSWSSASAGSKSTTATAFAITGTATIAGTLLCSTQARGTASNGGGGILYSAGSFTGGNKAVASGDTLNVTYTASV
jgi:hypothetical protein